MARVRTPNQKKAYNALNNRLTQYVSQVQSIYDMANRRMAEIAASTGYDGEVPFSFKDYPELAEAVKDVQAQFVNEIGTTIMRGTSEEWRQSNLIQDLLADKVLKHYRAQVRGKRFKQYYQTNSEALRAFQTRRERGLNLSDKLWMQSDLYRKEMEVAISTAIEKGMSAITLSKRISRYLSDYPSLKYDYWDKYAKAADCHDCEYRSIRLARSEINMAYRTAEQERWKQFDFITGYEIKLSGGHPRYDICDILKGKYPKDFDWTGWHPNDMCYAVPIIMSEDEYWDMKDDDVRPAVIEDVPENFKDYVRDNEKRIKAYAKSGTSPYWQRDNSKYLETALKPSFNMTEDAIENLKSSRGFSEILSAEDYNKSAMKRFNLPRFDDVFEDICDRYEIRLTSKKCYTFNDGVYLEYLGKSSSGGEVKLFRTFKKGKNGVEADHVSFKLPDELQGIGISKEVFRGLFAEYEDMHLSRINLTANATVGGYCWAKYGFCAKKSDILHIAEDICHRGKISSVEYDEVVSIANMVEGDTMPMNLLAQLPYAKDMLKGENWIGHLNFSDREQVKYMKDYIGYSR